MEASETFGAGVDDPADDPFAGSDFGELEGDDATLGGGAEIPTVNADGDVIDPPPAEKDPTPASSPASAAGAEATPATSPAAAPSAPAAPSEPAQPAETPPSAQATPAPTPEAATEQKTLADAEQAVAEAVNEVDVDDTAAAEEDLSVAQQAEDVAAAASPTPAAAAAPAAAETPALPTQAAAEESSADPEDAPPPDEKKDKRDRVTHRRYTILQVLGPDEFKRVSWYEDKDGKMVARGNGAKRQRIALARDGEQALAIGYAALGSPEKGVTLVAVAVSLFQPKTVQPDEPEPAKRKLKIS